MYVYIYRYIVYTYQNGRNMHDELISLYWTQTFASLRPSHRAGSSGQSSEGNWGWGSTWSTGMIGYDWSEVTLPLQQTAWSPLHFQRMRSFMKLCVR